VIAVNVADGAEALTTLFFWADNLYFIGFHTHNVLRVFRDAQPQNLRNILNRRGIFTREQHDIPWGSNYNNIPGGNDRQNLTISPESLRSVLYFLARDVNALTGDGPIGGREAYNRAYARALLTIATALLEALRFGRIEERIYDAIRRGDTFHFGQENVEATTSWGRISQWVTDHLQNPNNGPLTVAQHIFYTVPAATYYFGHLEILNRRYCCGRPQ
jgi:hypothetical protein